MRQVLSVMATDLSTNTRFQHRNQLSAPGGTRGSGRARTSLDSQPDTIEMPRSSLGGSSSREGSLRANQVGADVEERSVIVLLTLP